VLPPTTPEAHKYFFLKIREFSEAASINNKKTVNFEAFAQEWNRTADGKECFYVTTEVLSAYAKSWEKMSNVRASQELISEQMQSLSRSSQIFLAREQPFPNSITSNPTQVQPSRSVIDVHNNTLIPTSLSTALPLSRTQYDPVLLEVGPLPLEDLDIETQPLSGPVAHGIGSMSIDPDELSSAGHAIAKRRRVIPEGQRRRQAIRTCCRCSEATCPGNSNISNCPQPCNVPCKKCGHTEGCRRVDNGRTCTFKM
jgi:hypothetical protein